MKRRPKRLSTDHAAVAAHLRAAASKRFEMYTELQAIALTYGDEVEESGSIAASVHRGWLAVVDVLSSDSVEAVLGAATTGESYSIQQYETALAGDISDEFRPVLQLQLATLKSALSDLHGWASGAKS
jgi:uncharacterized protein (TIGR02284 family)